MRMWAFRLPCFPDAEFNAAQIISLSDIFISPLEDMCALTPP
jgi:hypothetical protein